MVRVVSQETWGAVISPAMGGRWVLGAKVARRQLVIAFGTTNETLETGPDWEIIKLSEHQVVIGILYCTN